MFKSVVVILAAISAAQAGVVLGRAGASCTCAGNRYDDRKISSSITLARAQPLKASASEGYPHEFKDTEGIALLCSGTTYEYPLSGGAAAFTHGSSGVDRVVYDGKGKFCGCITHTGATSRNGFVKCSF